MKAKEIYRVEAALGHVLATDYREFLATSTDEVVRLKAALDYVVTPWTTAGEIIGANVEEARPDRVLVATNGADRGVRNPDGKTPRDLAVENGKHEVAELLRL